MHNYYDHSDYHDNHELSEGWSPTRVTPSSNFLHCPIKMSRGSIVGWGQRYCLLPLVLLSRLSTRSTIGESFLYFQKVMNINQRTTEYTSNRVVSPSKASCSRWTSCHISLEDRTIQNQSHRRKDKCCFVFRLKYFEGLRDKMQKKSDWHIFWLFLWVVLLQLSRVGSKESGELKRLGVGKSGRWTI